MRKPTISIGYAPKNDALLAEMGLSAFCQHIEDFDVGRLQAQITRLMSHRAAYEGSIREASALLEGKLREQESRLASLLREPCA